MAGSTNASGGGQDSNTTSREGTPKKWMTRSEMATALRVHSPGVIGEVWALALREITEESTRLGRLEDKAKSLLTAAGTSLALAFSFGAKTMIDNRLYLTQHWVLATLLVILLACATWFGLRSSMNAVEALRAIWAAHRTLSHRTILHAETLSTADDARDLRETDYSRGVPAPPPTDPEPHRVAMYRRFILPQLWEVVQLRFTLNEEKAAIVTAGQEQFMSFLKTLVATAFVVAGHPVAHLLIDVFAY